MSKATKKKKPSWNAILLIFLVVALVAQTLGSKKVESIALVMHGTPTAIHISGKDEKVLQKLRKRIEQSHLNQTTLCHQWMII